MRDPLEISRETTVADVYDATRRVKVPEGQRVINGLKYIGGKQFFGKAVTLKCLPSRSDMNMETNKKAQSLYGVSSLRAHAVSLCDQESVLVIDAAGYNHSAIGGSTGMAALVAQKAVGIVTDGAIRDQEDFREYHKISGLSIAVSDFTIQSGTGSALYPYDVNVPVSVFGVLIRPGDYIFGNEDAVLVIPEAYAEEVLECGVMVGKFDAYIREISIQSGVISGKSIDFASDEFIHGFLDWAKLSPRQLEMYDKYQRPKK